MADTRVHNYYAIFGIPQSADSATIKSTYKRLSLAQHPDRRRNEPSATADFQLVSLNSLFPNRVPSLILLYSASGSI